MQPGTTQPQTSPQQLNWTALSDAISKGIIPAPAGNNDNGEPFWIFNNQKVTWQQVQVFVSQKLQQAQAAAPKTGGSPEVVPQMSQMPVVPDQGVEKRIERAPETAPERKQEQEKGDQGQQQAQTQATQVPDKPEEKKDSFVGPSPELQSVDTSNPDSMLSFYKGHKKDPIDTSDRFLAEFLEKVLQVLSLDIN